jgi:hypothetical protein
VAVKTKSIRQEQLHLSTSLRAQGNSWVEIAHAFRSRYGVNLRIAFRLAHGWSQRTAADEWNKRWPAHPKTFKSFSYWELWPSSSGHAPSLAVLDRLAQLYECGVADMLSDCSDYRRLDRAQTVKEDLEALPVVVGGVPEYGTNTAARTPRNGSGEIPGQAAGSGGAPSALARLASRIEEMDVHGLAGMVSRSIQELEFDGSRRAFLIKLSAGLALAAAVPALADHEPVEASSDLAGPGSHGQLSGIWLSKYSYFSSGRNESFQDLHYVVLRQQGNRLTGQSLPHTTDSKLHLELATDNSVVTGTWMEKTSPTGYYKGATYHGALQMLLDPMGRRMRGKWLGFGRDFEVNTGDWELTWVDGSLSSRVLREYRYKL